MAIVSIKTRNDLKAAGTVIKILDKILVSVVKFTHLSSKSGSLKHSLDIKQKKHFQ